MQLQVRFGKAIKALRIQLGISQQELADRSGLGRQFVSDVERGRRNVSLESAGQLANGLGISLATLFAQFSDAPGKSRK